MYRRSLALLLFLSLLAGCAGQDTPPVLPTPPLPTIAAGREPTRIPPTPPPTAAIGRTPVPALAATAAPTQIPQGVPLAIVPGDPAGGEGVLVYNAVDDGSIRAINLAQPDRELVLADPSFPGARLPWSVSPDGRTLALITGKNWHPLEPHSPWTAELWTVKLDESEPLKLLDLKAPAGSAEPFYTRAHIAAIAGQTPLWTSDGAHIILVSGHDAQIDLYQVPVDGGAPVRITNTPDNETAVTLSPDGTTISYIHNPNPSYSLGIADPDTSAWIQALAGGEPQPLRPRTAEVPDVEQGDGRGNGAHVLGWTADDRVLMHTTYPNGDRLIAAVGPEGVQEISTEALAAAWSASSQQLALVTAGSDRPSELLLWHPGDQQPQAVYALQSGSYQLHWSPDGSALVLCGEADQGRTRRLLMWNGTYLHDLGQIRDCVDLVWGPDGLFAVSSMIANSSGAVVAELPDQVIPAAWNGDALIVSTKLDDGWGFLQRDGGIWRELSVRSPGYPMNEAIIQ